ncbi:O-antigen ligase family protein [Coraliomargarita parva]|uniref:O-antigen ligase family protein n=1 Tax=Coraliomargarita parva TaxID=3014050 RepID=UPI0022B57769|nr:hypothetical protein [Coraliomargarita parva]
MAPFSHTQMRAGCGQLPSFVASNRDSKVFKRSAFTITNLCLNFIVIACLFLVNGLGEFGNTIFFICLAIMALRSVSGALKAVSILGISIMGNPYIVDQTIVVAYLRFPLIALAGMRILYEILLKRRDLLRLSHLNALILFGLVCVVLAPINGYFMQIAVLKAGLFTYGAYVILAGTELNRSRMSDLTVWFTALVAFVSIGTYITIPLGISHVFRGELLLLGGVGGLSGITIHQQTLGSFAAISAVFCFALGVFSKLPKRGLFILLFVSFLPILVMTKSRTAVGTLILSLAMIIVVAPFYLRGQKAHFNKFNFWRWFAGMCAVLVVGIFADFATGGRISTRVFEFALKGMAGRSYYDVQVTDVAISRMGLIEQSWQIFLDHPLSGINFGTSTSRYFIENASTFSAPTEKGFLPTALLEEVGLVGTSFFCIFVFMIFRKFYQDENIIGFAVFSGFLIQNLGEMMFFSFGGAGMYCWTVVGAGIAIGYRHQFVRKF